jgi:hypothetical protein
MVVVGEFDEPVEALEVERAVSRCPVKCLTSGRVAFGENKSDLPYVDITQARRRD